MFGCCRKGWCRHGDLCSPCSGVVERGGVDWFLCSPQSVHGALIRPCPGFVEMGNADS